MPMSAFGSMSVPAASAGGGFATAIVNAEPYAVFTGTGTAATKRRITSSTRMPSASAR